MKHTLGRGSPELEAVLSGGRRLRLESSQEDQPAGMQARGGEDARAPPQAQSYVQCRSL